MVSAEQMLKALGVECVSPEMLRAAKIMNKAARRGLSILFVGPVGSGKSTLAKATDKLVEARKLGLDLEFWDPAAENSPLVDCTHIKPELASSELWGHVKGAFNDAVKDKPGIVETVKRSGRLLLDEVGKLPLHVQAELLGLMQEGRYKRVGDEKTQQLKRPPQIIATTNVDITNPDLFLYDLLSRFKLIVRVPELRDRDDKEQLFTGVMCKVMDAFNEHPEAMTIGPEALEWLEAFDWPGQVRQLETLMEWAVDEALEDGRSVLHVEDFEGCTEVIECLSAALAFGKEATQKPQLEAPSPPPQAPPPCSVPMTYDEAMRWLHQFNPNGWTAKQVSELTGCSVSASSRKLQRLTLKGEIERLKDGRIGRGPAIYNLPSCDTMVPQGSRNQPKPAETSET